MAEVISLRIKYTEEEYAKASRLYLIYKTDFRSLLIANALFFALGILFYIVRSDFALPFILILADVVWIFHWALQLFVMPRRRFRRDPRFQDEYLLQFSDNGIQSQTPHIDTLIQWSLYTQVLEGDKFYFMVGKNTVTIVPKRTFASAAQQEAFNELLKRRIPAHSSLRPLKKPTESELTKPYTPPAEPPDWR